MQVFSVAGYGFETVTDGMAEVQNGAQTGFRFVLSNNFGFFISPTQRA